MRSHTICRTFNKCDHCPLQTTSKYTTYISAVHTAIHTHIRTHTHTYIHVHVCVMLPNQPDYN